MPSVSQGESSPDMGEGQPRKLSLYDLQEAEEITVTPAEWQASLSAGAGSGRHTVSYPDSAAAEHTKARTMRNVAPLETVIQVSS